MSTPEKVLRQVIGVSAKPANRQKLLLNGLFQGEKKGSSQHLAVERTPKKNPAGAIAKQFLTGDLRFLRWVLLLLSFVFLSFSSLQEEVQAQDTPDYFRQNCLSCHTIGGGQLTGPDLKNLSKRQERAWLIDFMMNPRAVIDGGDTYAKKIFEESRKLYMPTPPGITRERAEKLLDLIEAESQLEESQFRGLQISTAPFTDADRSSGRAIFLGTQPLETGGAACISCHSMHDSPVLGGGRLGPDLTNIYERLKGRAALSAWLMAPGTETMQPIFKNHPMSSEEINSLAAYFESTTSERPASSSTGQVAFLLLGLSGAVLGVFFLDALWSRRFHSVRRSLVQANTNRGKS